MEKGSQHREHPAPSMRSPELRRQRHDLLVQHVAKRSHQAHARLGRPSVVDQQATACDVDTCPDILACQSLAHWPGLVQQRDVPLCCHQAQKMHSSGCERQLARQHSYLLCRQMPSRDLLLRLVWCRPLQRWWMVPLGIKPHELRRCPPHCCQAVEAMCAPERLAPQAVQPLDNTVALGFANWQEDWLDTDVQTQAYKCAKHPRHFVAAIEGRVVVELQAIRKPDLLPSSQRVC